MKRIKVIGIGSPFGNDQLGWEVIDALRKQASSFTKNGNGHRQHISLLTCDRPGTQLLEFIKDVDTAILIDAIDNKDCAGQELQLDHSQLLSTERSVSSHSIGVAETLLLGQTLGILPNKLTLFGICVDRENRLPVTRKQVLQLCNNVSRYISEF